MCVPLLQAARVFIGIVVAGHYPLSHHPARSGAVDLAGLAGLSEAARDNVVAPVFTLLFVLSSVAVSREWFRSYIGGSPRGCM